MNNLPAILTEQLACCEKLSALQETQRDRLRANDTDGVIDVLQKRQAVVDRFSQLDVHVKPVRQGWQTIRPTLADADGIEQLLRDVRDRLEVINESDRQDMLVLQQRKLNVGRQLNGATAARKAHRAYGTSRASGRLDTRQ